MKSFRFRIWGWTAGSLLFMAVCAFCSLAVGSVSLAPHTWFGLEPGSLEHAVFFQIRIPRMLSAIAVGGMLSLSGCVLQGIFKNPLVEPYTLGLSGGAGLGVAVVFVCGLSGTAALSGVWAFSAASVAALIGALAVSGVLLLYYHFRPHIHNLLLAGIMLGILCSSCTTLLMSLSSPENITRIVYWTMGSLENNAGGHALSLFVFASICCVLCSLLSQRINILGTGVDSARHLGVNTRVLITLLMFLCSVMTALSVASAGIIGFVGLVVPHILRNLSGNDYRILIPSSFLCGAGFLLLCDILARTLVRPSQLPIGVVTGIVGGTVFIYLLLKPKKHPYA